MDKETWKNSTRGLVQVKKFDRFGNETVELVRSGKQVMLTPDERVSLNSERAASSAQDNFRNGTMVPVKLLDSTEDAAEIASNPNLKTESELATLATAHHKTFEKEVADITNVSTLKRLEELAIEQDATVGRVRRIQELISDLTGGSADGDTVESFGLPGSTFGAPNASGGSLGVTPL